MPRNTDQLFVSFTDSNQREIIVNTTLITTVIREGGVTRVHVQGQSDSFELNDAQARILWDALFPQDLN